MTHQYHTINTYSRKVKTHDHKEPVRIFTVVYFITTKNFKNSPTVLQLGEWRDKLWYSHTMEYDSAIKGNEQLIHITINIGDSQTCYVK